MPARPASDLPARLCRHLDGAGLLPPGSRVLVAVSGGADSVALLFLLHRIAPARELFLEAAHLDHALRPDSSADAAHVRTLCLELGLALTARRTDVAALARSRRGGLEEAAREARRAFLRETARERGCDWVALAHQRDDQAETFLLRLLRGAGTAGLAGMRAVAPPFVRPLLPFCRAELVAWLAAEGIAWREDASNLDPAFTRNRVRHELLPLLESFNPAVRGRLVELCRQSADDESDWAQRVAGELQRHAEFAEGECRLPCVVLAQASPALAGRLVRAALQAVRGDLRRIEATHVAAILSLATGIRPQGEAHLPGAWVARRYELMWFRQAPPVTRPVPTVTIAEPGLYPLGDGRTLSVQLHDRERGEGALAAEFSLDLVGFPLQLRGPLPGDRLQPGGMTGSRKLQDLFVDHKVTAEARDAAVLVCAGGRLLWVAGIRRCAGLQPAPGGPVLRLELLGSVTG